MQRITFIALLLIPLNSAAAKDWPLYRADAARSGYTEEALPAQLSLAWSYRPRHAPQPAWPRDERMAFDQAFQVVIADGRVFFGSSADCTVYALDAATGKDVWSFVTDGPIRFAPAVWKDRVFVVSDDGYLYCLRAVDGTLINKWRGGPEDKRVLGNEHIISRWPARGGPAIVDGVVYWAAGIWQSEGVFLYALNAETGAQLWKNDDANRIEMPQPHPGANAVSGVTVQGYLVAADTELFTPTGRSVPAAFARSDGQFQYYRLQENQQRGGIPAMADGPLLYNGGYAYDRATGLVLPDRLEGVICRFSEGIIQANSDRLRGYSRAEQQVPDRKGKPVQRLGHQLLWQIEQVPAGTCLIAAGQTIVSAGGARLATVALPAREVVWSHEFASTVYGLAAARARLYVSCGDGTIHCFAGEPTAQPPLHTPAVVEVAADRTIAAAAEEIIRQSEITEGYCVDLACGDGSLALELARRTHLNVLAIDADEQSVAEARRKIAAAGYYGARVTVHCGNPRSTAYPKYFANLVVSQRALSAGPDAVDKAELLRLQRPFGGVACIGKSGALEVSRRGALEGAGQWTHLYADAANTLCSSDTIQGPLHALWFRDMDLDLPQRHGRGPAPLFANGRLFVEGHDALLAVDAYNGRPLWRYESPGILQAYHADHLAGTAITGGNFCLGEDSVFLRRDDRCYRIDAATGKTLTTYPAPNGQDGRPGTWGYIACEQGILYGSLANREHIVRHAYRPADDLMQYQYSESTALFALDVASGRLLWRYDAEQSIRHNAIAVGGGRVYLVDRPLAVGDLLSRASDPRRGKAPEKAAEQPKGKLLALDARTGRILWTDQQDVFGTMLAFSPAHELLLCCYQATRFKLPSEAGGRMAVYRAGSGARLWSVNVDYTTRPLIRGRTIVAYPAAVDLLSGEVERLDFVKSYGCGELAASQNLLLFRSATLGYYDSVRQQGTENFGGIRPGCWINTLPVGGLVLFPDASSGCRCSYQNRAWMALEGG